MKNIVEKIASIPHWYGIAIILVYALLMAEFYSAINDLCIDDDIKVSSIMEVFLGVSYVLTIISSIMVWIILCLIFHLAALLFDGKQAFSKFLFTSSYLYIIPSIALFIVILMIGNLEVEESENMIEKLMDNSRFKLIMSIVNYSFYPFYLLTACIIHHLYNLKWLYAILVVIIPIVSIWGVTELFRLL